MAGGAFTAESIAEEAGIGFGANPALLLPAKIAVAQASNAANFFKCLKADWGAKGDGTTDDTAVVVAAFAAGGNLWIPPGTYKIVGSSTLLSIVSGFRCWGAGKGQAILDFHITASAAANCIQITSARHKLQDLTIRITGDNSNIVAFRLSGTITDLDWENIEIDGSPSELGLAASFTGAIVGTDMTTSAVTSGAIAIGQRVVGAAANTTIVSGSGTAWVVSPSQTLTSRLLSGSTGASDNRVHGVVPDDNCIIRNVRWVGLEVHDLSYGMFTNTTSNGTYEHWTISECFFYNNTGDDLEFNSNNNLLPTWRGVTVTACHFYGWKGDPTSTTGGFAIGMDSVQDVIIALNHFSDYPIRAVHIEDYLQNVQVRLNRFKGCMTSIGCYPTNAQAVAITDNIIRGTLGVAAITASITTGGAMTVTANSTGKPLFPGVQIIGNGVPSGCTVTVGSGTTGSFTVSPAPGATVTSRPLISVGGVDMLPSGFADPSTTMANNNIGIICDNPGVTSSPAGVKISGNTVYQCVVGIYAPSDRGGECSDNLIFNCVSAAYLPLPFAERFERNRIYLCKYALWAAGALIGKNTYEDCTNLIFDIANGTGAGKSAPFVLNGWRYISKSRALTASTTTSLVIVPMPTRIDGKASIAVQEVASGNTDFASQALAYNGTTLTATINQEMTTGSIAQGAMTKTSGNLCLPVFNGIASTKNVALNINADGMTTF